MCLCKAAEAEINCARFFVVLPAGVFLSKRVTAPLVQRELGSAALLRLCLLETPRVFYARILSSCRSETGAAPEVKELRLKAAFPAVMNRI